MPMELYRAGEALLHSSPPRLLLRLAPAVHRLPQRSRTAAAPDPVARQCSRTRDASRTFSTTHRRRERPNGVPSPASRVHDDISSFVGSMLNPNKGTPATPATRTSDFSSPTRTSGFSSPTRTSSFSSPDAQSRSAASREIAKELAQARVKGRSSLDELVDRMTKPIKRVGQVQSQHSGNEFTSIVRPISDGPPPVLASEEPPVDLPKNVGRMVEVNEQKNIDVARAFRSMEIGCSRNKVRHDFNAQRYHERPGLKRKRLKRARWARRFKRDFVATVALVQRMNKQGW